MEYIPDSSDISSPKGVIVVNTLAAVVFAAVALRIWMKRALAGGKVRTGAFAMAAKDFGDEAETRRDAARTFAAGCIAVSVDGGPLQTLKPPPGLQPGVDTASVAAHVDAFTKMVAAAGVAADEATIARLLPMLTVNPALGALSAAGELPMLKHNRFVIRTATAAAAADDDGGGGDGAAASGAGASLHCLTVGIVGAPPTGKPKPEEVLTVASPNLLESAAADAPRSYELTYTLRRAQCSTLDEEMKRPGVIDVGEPTS